MSQSGWKSLLCSVNDSKMLIKFLKKKHFFKVLTPRVLVSDNGTHLCNKPLEYFLKKYGVLHTVTCNTPNLVYVS